MTSIALPLAALLAFQGATHSPARPRECEPTDNRCKAAMYVRRAAAAVAPKERALYLHAAHRSYLALFDQTGNELHLCAARKTYEQSLAVVGQPDKQRESFAALVGDLTAREAEQPVQCSRGTKGAAKSAAPRIAAANGSSRAASVGEGPVPARPPTAATAAKAGQAPEAEPPGSSETPGTGRPRTALLLEPAPSNEAATAELMPVVRGPAPSDRLRGASRVIDGAERPGRQLVIAGGVTLGAGLVLASVAGYMGGRLLDTRRQAQDLLGEIDNVANVEQTLRNEALEADYRRLGPPTLALALAGGASVIVATVLLAVGGRRMSRAPSRTAFVPVPGGVALHTRF